MKKLFGIVSVMAALLALGFTAPSAQAGTVGGHVLDVEGSAVAGANVVIQGLDRVRGQRPFMARVESDVNGVFVFENVPAGLYIVTAMARELGGARAEVGLRAEAVVRLELRLQGRGHGGGNGGGEEREVVFGALSGTVIDAEGAAVAGARVNVSPARIVARHGMRGGRHLTTVTDVNGAFSFAEIPVGAWVVMARAREAGAGSERVEIEAEAEANVQITLQNRR